MEGPAVLVSESTLRYTQLFSLCRSFTFSPVPLFSFENRRGLLVRLGDCPRILAVPAWFLRLLLQNLTEFSWIFLFVFGFIFCLKYFYWHQFCRVYTCSNKSLSCGLEGLTRLLAGVGVCPGLLLHSREFICKLSLNIFSFFFFSLIDQKNFELFPFRPLF